MTKELRNKYKHEEREKLLKELPLAPEYFKIFIEKLEQLEQQTACDHTLRLTETILEGHPEKLTIIKWLKKYGGNCDCNVLGNVVNEYSFILFSTSRPQRSSSTPTSSPLQKIERFTTSFDIGLDMIPAPWQAFKDTSSNINKYLFSFGKKKLQAELYFFIVEEPLAFDNDENSFKEAWKQITKLTTISENITVEKEALALKNSSLSLVSVSSQRWIPIIIFGYDDQNPNWHLITHLQRARAINDKKELFKLLQRFQ